MSRRLWALALAVVMIASALAAVPAVTHVGGAHAAPATGSSGVRADAGTISIALYNGYGFGASTFTSGTSPDAIIYFEIFDPSGDLNVNVTINDPNATRDGVGAPAFHAQVPINQTTFIYKSWLVGVEYTIPAALVYGGVWNLTASAPLGGSSVSSFSILTYFLSASSAPNSGSVVLPGESLNLLWQINSYQYVQGGYNGPYTHATNLTMTGTYTGFNGSANVSMFVFPRGWASLPVAAIGQTTLTIPDNATPGYYLTVDLYATVYMNGQIVENESSHIDFLVGFPSVNYAYLSSNPSTNCPFSGQSYFSVGQPIFACAVAGASYGADFTPVGGLTIGIHYTNLSSTVTVPGAPTSLVSNSAGVIAFSFTASSPPFIWAQVGYPFANSVNYTVSDPSATAWAETHTSNWYAVAFFLQQAAATGDVAVGLDQAVYLPGQTITATWTAGTSNQAITGPLTPIYWELENSNGQVVGQGLTSSGSPTGSATVTLPSGYQGTFYYGVFAENATTVFAGWASASVATPVIYLNPSSTTYLPGSTVTVTVADSGTGGATGLTLDYSVVAEYYSPSAGYQNSGVSQSGTVANGSSFNIAVPSTDSPAYYLVTAWLVAANGATLATQTTQVDELSGYQLLLSLQTSSQYSDGSYQPGETLTFTYSLSAYGATSLPAVYDYTAYLDNTPLSVEHQGAGTSGSFQITVPSNYPGGSAEVYMDLAGSGLNGPNCGGSYCFSWVLFAVNPHPSALNQELVPNSGLTVGWVILLVLILVVAVLLVLMLRRRRSPPASAPATAAGTTPMSPPAPAPSGGAPPEWKEPNPGNDQPPMPSPPAGSE